MWIILPYTFIELLVKVEQAVCSSHRKLINVPAIGSKLIKTNLSSSIVFCLNIRSVTVVLQFNSSVFKELSNLSSSNKFSRLPANLLFCKLFENHV